MILTSTSISEQPNISGMRLLPASLNPNAIGSIDHADVIYNADTDSYRVTLWPLNCWHDFDLFELLNSEVCFLTLDE